MAPSITRRAGTNNTRAIDQDSSHVNSNMNGSIRPSEHQNPSPPNIRISFRVKNEQLALAEDDGLFREFEEPESLIDIPSFILTTLVEEAQQRLERLKIKVRYLEAKICKLTQEASSEGSNQALATRLPQGFITCLNCFANPATMAYYPCRQFCVCLECDTKISRGPICNGIKHHSVMFAR